MIIYKLTSPSGKCYVGKTTSTLENRFASHCNEAVRENNKSTRPILRAIKKYGKENFTVEILEECLDDQGCEREIFWISELKSNNPKFGYNATAGGEGVDSETASKLKKDYWDSERSIENRARLSARMQENNPGKKNKGKPAWNTGLSGYLSEEARALMSQKQKERWNEEAKRERSEQTKQLWESGAYNNRPLPTQETIDKRIATNKKNGFKQTDYQKHRAREVNTGTKFLVKKLSRKLVCRIKVEN